MQKKLEILCIIFLCFTAVILIALQIKPIGWYMLTAGVLFLPFCSKNFRRNIALIYFCLGVLGITPINASTAFPHTIQMGIPLGLVVLIPYLVTKYVYKNHLIRFPFHHGRAWYRSEILYIVITSAIAYLLLPLMLRSADSYVNWPLERGFVNLTYAYIGLNCVGIWDELFFVITVLGILRRHLPFAFANIVQAVIFTSFLFALGFQGWSFIVIFIFALIQGYIFKKTESLLYVLTIHLTFDLILHLALVYLHFPDLMLIFIT